MGSVTRRLRRAVARAEPERRVPGDFLEHPFGEGAVVYVNGKRTEGVRAVEVTEHIGGGGFSLWSASDRTPGILGEVKL